MQRADWSDLRIIRAVRSEGSVAAAARRLGVNASTVLRRISAIEADWGVRLFDRLPRGYIPTSAGTLAADRADQISEAIDDLERQVIGRDVSLSGQLRVTTTDTLMASVLPEFLLAFGRRNPAIRLEVLQTNEMLSLMDREADVAIRPSAHGSDSLFGALISPIAFAAYVSVGSATPLDASGMRWVGFADSLQSTSAGRWMAGHVKAADVVARVDSLVAARDLAASGAGAVFLPCYLGDTSPRLSRLEAFEPENLNELWIVSHKDLRRTARVHQFITEASEYLRSVAPLLRGEAPGSAESAPKPDRRKRAK